MGLTFNDAGDMYLDKGQCQICGKPTYRMGLESGDRERGEKEPLICNSCLITLRGDMYTEWELRGRVARLETMWKVYASAFSVVFGLLGLLIGKFLL